MIPVQVFLFLANLRQKLFFRVFPPDIVFTICWLEKKKFSPGLIPQCF